MRNQVVLTHECLASAAVSIIGPVRFGLIGMMAWLAIGWDTPACAQSEGENDATISADADTVRTIVLESRTPPPPPPEEEASVMSV